jgi:hypothetical protein
MSELNLSNNKALADFCEVSEGLVTQWFSGQTKLGPKPLKAFSRTNINLDWLTTGKLPKYRSSFEAQIDNIEKTAWGGLTEGPALESALTDLSLRASPKSQETLNKLIELAKSNSLNDDDWEAIEWIANRIGQKP